MSFPSSRLRRLRSSEGVRRLARESVLSPDDFICPIFVDEGADSQVEVDSMPGVYRIPLKEAGAEAGAIRDLGIPAVMLFGVPARKDDAGSGAYGDSGIAQRAIEEIRSSCGSMVIMADVCLCQ